MEGHDDGTSKRSQVPGRAHGPGGRCACAQGAPHEVGEEEGRRRCKRDALRGVVRRRAHTRAPRVSSRALHPSHQTPCRSAPVRTGCRCSCSAMGRRPARCWARWRCGGPRRQSPRAPSRPCTRRRRSTAREGTLRVGQRDDRPGAAQALAFSLSGPHRRPTQVMAWAPPASARRPHCCASRPRPPPNYARVTGQSSPRPAVPPPPPVQCISPVSLSSGSHRWLEGPGPSRRATSCATP